MIAASSGVDPAEPGLHLLQVGGERQNADDVFVFFVPIGDEADSGLGNELKKRGCDLGNLLFDLVNLPSHAAGAVETDNDVQPVAAKLLDHAVPIAAAAGHRATGEPHGSQIKA